MQAEADAERCPIIGQALFQQRDFLDEKRIVADVADADTTEGSYDLVTAFECIHDMPRPVEALRAMRTMVAPGGAVIVMDERAEERFTAPASDVDRFLYGFSLLVCLPDGLSHEASVGTGTVMRPATFERYAMEAGFARVEILDALREGLGLIAVYLSLVNAFGHCAQALALRRYNPGLATAIGLFIPLGLVTLRVLAGHPEVTRTDHILGLAVALLIHAAIIVRVVSRKRQLRLPAVPATGRA